MRKRMPYLPLFFFVVSTTACVPGNRVETNNISSKMSSQAHSSPIPISGDVWDISVSMEDMRVVTEEWLADILHDPSSDSAYEVIREEGNVIIQSTDNGERQTILQRTNKDPYEDPSADTPFIWSEELFNAMNVWGIEDMHWSPDGRYLSMPFGSYEGGSVVIYDRQERTFCLPHIKNSAKVLYFHHEWAGTGSTYYVYGFPPYGTAGIYIHADADNVCEVMVVKDGEIEDVAVARPDLVFFSSMQSDSTNPYILSKIEGGTETQIANFNEAIGLLVHPEKQQLYIQTDSNELHVLDIVSNQSTLRARLPNLEDSRLYWTFTSLFTADGNLLLRGSTPYAGSQRGPVYLLIDIDEKQVIDFVEIQEQDNP